MGKKKEELKLAVYEGDVSTVGHFVSEASIWHLPDAVVDLRSGGVGGVNFWQARFSPRHTLQIQETTEVLRLQHLTTKPGFLRHGARLRYLCNGGTYLKTLMLTTKNHSSNTYIPG